VAVEVGSSSIRNQDVRLPRTPSFCLSILLVVLLLALPDLAAAQLSAAPADTVMSPPAQTVVSPRGAFLRALAVPGWGHVAIGSFTRGGFYFVSESAAAWMMVRTRTRLNAAKEVEEFRRAEVTARLAAAGLTDQELLLEALANDSTIVAAGSLVEARSQQFEDWLVLGVFLAFFSGADAFVSAHLRDFPSPVGVAVTPLREGVEVQLRLPLNNRRRGSRPTRP
jgi:hypothetical protein